MDSNEIGYLADALVRVAQGADREHLKAYEDACIQFIRDRNWECAERIAKEKDNASRFQAPMRDDDWDDYKMRMTA